VPRAVSLDDLCRTAEELAGEPLRTTTGKEFTVGVYLGCPFFTPLSTGNGRSDGAKAARAFLERWNATGSTTVSDYADVTRNASYLIPLAQRSS
jgi:hypothetical protein